MSFMKRKVFALILVIMIVLSSFPLNSFAFESLPTATAAVPEPMELSAKKMAETDFTYTIANNKVTITGYTGADAEVLIPEAIESHPVTAIDADAFKNNAVMETVVVPACVETIGNGAFEGSSVKFVTAFGGTLGENAFKNCLSLELMSLGDGVTSISSTAFIGCSSLTSITVTQANAVYCHIDGVLFNDAATALICYPQAKPDVVYFVPDTVAEITANAFYGTRFLSNIVIKNNVTTISGSNLGRTAETPQSNISGFVIFGYIPSAAKTYADTYGIEFYNLDAPPVSNFTYEVEENCATITGYTGSYRYMIIPAVIDGYPVTKIGGSAFEDEPIGAVCIPSSVTVIVWSAFKNCSNLKSVSIPDSVTEIYSRAFYQCTALSGVTLSKGLTSLGGDAFYNCDNITEIEIPKSLTDVSCTYDYEGPFNDCDGLKTVIFESGTTEVTHFLFAGCPGIENIVIPDTVTVIEHGAFYNATNLKSASVPDSVTEIGNEAFYQCTALSDITLSKGLTTLGGNAFYNCDNITEVEIPKSLDYTDYGSPFNDCDGLKTVTFESGTTKVTERLFANCPGIENIVIPDTVTVIERGAFYNATNLKSVSIPDSVTEIGREAFYQCTVLSDITLSKGLTTLGYDAFYNCDNITEIEIPKSLTDVSCTYDYKGPFNDCDALKTVTFESGATEVSSCLFANCPGIESIVIPDTVTVIEYGAFYNATNLKSIVLSQNLTKIESEAFYNCTELSSVTLPKGLTTLGGNAFYNCDNITEVEIPKSLDYTDYGSPFNDCDGLKTVTFESGTTKVTERLFANCPGIESIVIPDTVTVIEYGAFYNATNLKSVVLSQNLTKIESEVFYNCTSLENIDIPDSVTEIYSRAFYQCTALSGVTLSKGLTTLGYDAFYNCDNITEVEIPKSLTDTYGTYDGYVYMGPFSDCDGLKIVTFESGATEVSSYLFANCPGIESIVIPDTVTVIEYGAFYNATNLKSIVLSQNLTKIESEAFYNCTSLENIDIPDSVKELGTEVFRGCSSLVSAELSNALVNLPEGTFSCCTSLAEIDIPATVKNIRSSAFYNCTSLASVDLPPTITSIESYAFYNCDALTAITLPDNITVINERTFYDCDGLVEITIPEGVTDILTYAFYDCDALTAVTLPSTLNNIEYCAFRSCDLLENINFGHKLVANTTSSIESCAFADCPAIKTVKLPRGLKTVGENAFLNNTLMTNLYVPVSVTSIASNAISYPSLLTIYGVAGTYAQTYAVQKGANFVDIANHIDGLILKDNPDERYEMVKGEYLVPEFEYTTEFEGETTDIIVLSSSNNCVRIDDNRLYAYYTGTATITATTSGGLDYQFTVYVRAVSSIAVTTPPLKTSYSFGQELDLTGMVVTATYNDGFSQPVTDYTVSGYNPEVYGDQTVTVIHSYCSATFTVTVVDDRVYVTSIAVTTPPDKIIYIKGESLNTAGMVVTATYTDASTEPVTGFTVSGFNKLKLGVQTLTVTYTDPTTAQTFTTTFQVAVVLENTQILQTVQGSGCVVDFTGKYIYGLNPGTASLQGLVEAPSGYEVVCVPTASGFGTGTVVNVMFGGNVIESYVIVIFGDVNGDGIIDSMDSGAVVDYENFFVDWVPATDHAKLKAGDINGDGVVDSMDAGIMVDVENYIVDIDQSTGLIAG